MKIYSQSGYNYRKTPTIILRGNWLTDMGFQIGNYISVSCDDGKLVITPDRKRAALEKAKAAFMEKETKLLKQRFEVDKEKLLAQHIAESKAGYGK